MKKDVTYYLEDTSRLKEISKSELDDWIAEMPFHQPLQMLAGIKSEMEGHATDDDPKVYAAYFAEDFEATKSGKNKKGKKKSGPKAQNDQSQKDQSTESEVQPTEEDNKIGVVTSSLADDFLEDEVIQEVLEEKIETVVPSAAIVAPELDSVSEVADIKNPSIDEETHEEVNSPVEIDDEDNAADLQSVDDVADDVADDKKVNYSDYTNIAPKKKKRKKKKKKKKEIIIESTSISLEPAIDPDLDTEASESAPGKKKKTKSKKKVANKKSETKKSKKKKKKDKDKLSIQIKPKKKDNKAEEANSEVKKKASSEVKEKKSKTKKKKKGSKKVRYVLVDSGSEKDFKLKDYEGVSSYTSWLLEQETINDTDNKKGKQAVDMKKSKKKKKKKSKKLKVAQDSVKKQDYIISEPLANILAMQGHKKKAKKMYLKLSKVFPEKEAYFAEKIEALNK